MEAKESLAMDLMHVVGLTSAVREAQKKYFETRKKEDLIVSKRLEAGRDSGRSSHKQVGAKGGNDGTG